MTGLCGWYLKNDQNIACENEIRAMLSKVAQPKTLQQTQAITTSNSISSGMAVADFIKQSIFNTTELMIACSGHITWKNKALKQRAQQDGNAAVIAQLYRESGNNLFQYIHNDFSVVIIDKEKDIVILAIDRMGIQRLCFQVMDESIVFSSDIQAIVNHPATTKTLSEQGIFNYFYFHMVPSPDCIYQNVEKILPGQYVFFSKGNISRHFYWKIDYQDNSTETFEHSKTRFRELLRETVKTRLNEQPTGAFLSGGLDSSTMSGVLSEIQGKSDTFSIGFNVEGYDETPFARTASKHFNTNHHEYYVTPEDVLEAIPLIAQAYDEPFGNASAIPAYYCAKLAQEKGIKTMIGGDGGDEIFAGNERYSKQKVFELYNYIPTIIRHGILEPVFFNIPGATSLPIIKKINSYIQQAKIPLPERFETYNFLNRTPLDSIFDNDFLTQINPNWPLDMQKEVYDRTSSSNTLNKMLHLDMKVTLADNDLQKVNRMCALAGVDVIYPFMDDEMVNFAATVHPDLKLKAHKLRYFFKQSLSDFLPHEVIHKQKHGFGLPFGDWLNEYKPLHSLAYDSLLSLEKRGYFNRNYLEALWKSHENEHSSYFGVMIWIMMMFEQWLSSHE